MSRRRHSNIDLPPLPSDEEFIKAVADICDDIEKRGERFGYYRRPEATANDVAYWLKIHGARRHGRGAVKGSWSGRMSGALRAAPRLRSLARRGLLEKRYDRDNYRDVYAPASN